MDLTWDEKDREFRQQVRSDLQPYLQSNPRDVQNVGLDWMLGWEESLRLAGYHAVDWPAEYGGQAFDPVKSLIFHEEYFRSGAPRRLNFPGLGVVGPTVMAVGSDEQRRELLPRILDNRDVWCQGFSEPEAGSDLASLRTSATRHGDVYIVNGQKTWCTNASRANKVFCLVRTDPSAPKHKGLSYLLVDMDLPGLEVRPIHQMTGGREFAEVFFRDVEVPVTNRLGPENEGWRVANTSLTFERGPSRSPVGSLQGPLEEARRMLSSTDEKLAAEDKVSLVRLAAQVQCWHLNYLYGVTAPQEDDGARRLGLISKMVHSEIVQSTYELSLQGLGKATEVGISGLPDGVGADWHRRYWYERCNSIFAGTNQIQELIIAQRLLGLPKEPRP
jgi:alkylation response protein AidB-like acyl-CoA dehydrogenase